MPQRVVDALEVVQVEDSQAAESALVAGLHGLGDDLMKIRAVGEPGEAVIAGHRADLLLSLARKVSDPLGRKKERRAH